MLEIVPFFNLFFITNMIYICMYTVLIKISNFIFNVLKKINEPDMNAKSYTNSVFYDQITKEIPINATLMKISAYKSMTLMYKKIAEYVEFI